MARSATAGMAAALLAVLAASVAGCQLSLPGTGTDDGVAGAAATPSAQRSSPAADAPAGSADEPPAEGSPASATATTPGEADPAALVDRWTPLRVPEAGLDIAFPIERSNVTADAVAGLPAGFGTPSSAVVWRAEVSERYVVRAAAARGGLSSGVLPGGRDRRAGALALFLGDTPSELSTSETELGGLPAELVEADHEDGDGARARVLAVVTERAGTVVALELTADHEQVTGAEARALLDAWLESAEFEPLAGGTADEQPRVALPQFPGELVLPGEPVVQAVTFQGPFDEVQTSTLRAAAGPATVVATGYRGPGVVERSAADPVAALVGLAVETAAESAVTATNGAAPAGATVTAELAEATAVALTTADGRADQRSPGEPAAETDRVSELAGVHRVDGLAVLPGGDHVRVSGFIDGETAVVLTTLTGEGAQPDEDAHLSLVRSLDW